MLIRIQRTALECGYIAAAKEGLKFRKQFLGR